MSYAYAKELDPKKIPIIDVSRIFKKVKYRFKFKASKFKF